MNWPRAVKGAKVLDYITSDASSDMIRDLNSGATDMMGKMFDLMGAKPYLLWPPVSHIRNHVDWMLQVMTAHHH